MTPLEPFLDQLITPAFLSIAVLMLSTFLLGYFMGIYGMKSSKEKKIADLKKQVNSLLATEKVKDIETIFSEIKPRIIQVVKEQQKEVLSEPEVVVSKIRSAYVKYALSDPKLNFENIGFGNEDNKDELTNIDGIGPYIEQKLNEVGIYNYYQISRLELRDIKTLTSLIDFFPGRIERDDWIGQAKELTLIKK